jgi:putative ATP-dependent endonuclease of the OLD family
MKLKNVRIYNFKSIKDIEFEFPDSGILVLVGENNAGKSNIIRAIDATCGEAWYGKDKLEDHDHYLRDKTKQIGIKLTFDNDRVFVCKPTSADWGVKYYANSSMTSTMQFGSNIKEDYPCTYLGADRTFDKHLSFYDWTLIGRIRKAFHKRIPRQLSDEIKNGFDDIIEIFNKVEGFKNFKDDFTKYFTELLPLTSTKIGIDFKPFTPANLFKSMQILATDEDNGGNVIDVNELGEGARNLILISLLRSYAKNLKSTGEDLSGILALEEPELFLHPQARRHLAKILRELASTGIQVIISTHSDSFIDTEFFNSIGRIIKVEDEDNENAKMTKLVMCSKNKLVDHCINTGVPEVKTNIENISEFYKTTSNVRLNEGFFAKLLILVEGETEELCLPIYLQNIGVDCDSLGISIIPVQGKSQIAKYWRLYSQFEIPIIVVFDNDESDAKQNANVQLSKCFGITTDDILQNCVIAKKIDGFQNTPIIVLETDFETSIKKEVGDDEYDSFEKEAKEFIKPIRNQQKGAVSRYIARQILSQNNDFIPVSVGLIKAEISKILKIDFNG